MAALAIIDRHDEFPHKPLLMAFVLLQPDVVVVVVVRRRALGRLTDMRPQSGCGELGGGEVSTEVQLVWDWDGNEMDCDWEVCNHSCVIGGHFVDSFRAVAWVTMVMLDCRDQRSRPWCRQMGGSLEVLEPCR
ncbi:unnamed protein product [Gadus morhua 'NCC']